MIAFLPISNKNLTASGLATLTKGRRGVEEETGGGEIEGGPFELLMHEKLPRLLSINFSNYGS